MGYTHYFPQRREIAPRTFGKIAEDVKYLLDSGDYRIPELANGSGDEGTSPKITKELILLNGVEEDSHESFYLPIKHGEAGYYPEGHKYQRFGFNFCKTARKPYDIVVCAALLICYHHHKTWLEIGSDGNPEDTNPYEYPNAWLPARGLVRDVLGYYPQYPPGIVPSEDDIEQLRGIYEKDG